jgi:bifunctional non-homologous end joining protein LigD
MGLKEYQRKRHFGRTPEPKGGAPQKTGGNSYLIQKHAARRLHYDLRLELDGVMLSWAIPKGPSLDPKERRLAVQVEDHPIEYGDFEGNIPRGEYGAGTVLLWDRGTWEPEGDPHEGLRRGDLKFRLHGEKLHGSWVLIRMRKPADDDQKGDWLLIKHPDEWAVPLDKRDILQERPESVSTGRSMEQIAADYDREWTLRGETPRKELRENDAEKRESAMAHLDAKKGKKKTVARNRAVGDPADLPGAKKSRLPERIRPQLATLMDQVPEGENWLHEIKFDGYRAICKIENREAHFFTREWKDWTDRFGNLREAAASLPVKSALLDGEVVVLLPNGATSFEALQNSLGRRSRQLIYYAFDLLYLDGFDLRNVPLLQRKKTLSSIFRDSEGLIRFSDHFQGQGEEIFKRACEYPLEGIISKRADRPYMPGRGADWLKVKCLSNQEFVIGGFTEPAGSRTGFGALLVGMHQNGDLVYSGKVGTGYSDKTLNQLHSRLERLQQPKPPFSNPPKGAAVRKVHWVRPELVAQVQFTGWTRDGILRHPSFQGLREDKRPDEVRKEEPAEAPKPGSGAVHDKTNPEIAGVRISNPDRILYEDQGITKIELARYYESISDWALPHIRNRPLMFLRCPEGSRKECFFQKHASDSVSDLIKRIPISGQDTSVTGLAIDSLPGLISLARMGVLEIHSWGSRIDRIEQPDLMVFDLDPDQAVQWQGVIEAAHEIRSILEVLGLRSFVKTTGGKGLHVVVPLTRRADWDEVKEFSKQVAETLVREFPDRYVAVMSKARRKGKIFVDYLRNGRGATFICPYSTRARPGAPVSTPIDWDELTPDLRSDQFNIRNLPKRLAELTRDPWEGIEKVRQSIAADMRKKLQ